MTVAERSVANHGNCHRYGDMLPHYHPYPHDHPYPHEVYCYVNPCNNKMQALVLALVRRACLPGSSVVHGAASRYTPDDDGCGGV